MLIGNLLSSKGADDAGGDRSDQIPGDQRGCNPSPLQTPYGKKRIIEDEHPVWNIRGMKTFQIQLVNT